MVVYDKRYRWVFCILYNVKFLKTCCFISIRTSFEKKNIFSSIFWSFCSEIGTWNKIYVFELKCFGLVRVVLLFSIYTYRKLQICMLACPLWVKNIILHAILFLVIPTFWIIFNQFNISLFYDVCHVIPCFIIFFIQALVERYFILIRNDL